MDYHNTWSLHNATVANTGKQDIMQDVITAYKTCDHHIIVITWEHVINKGNEAILITYYE